MELSILDIRAGACYDGGQPRHSAAPARQHSVTIRTELESILVEQALAMARQLELASDAAPDGRVLAVSEAVALRAGRELTRRALEATLQRQAGPAEKKGLPAGPAPAVAVAGSRTRRPARQ